MPNIKTDMNYNLLTQKTENIKRMGYYEKTLKLIAKFIYYLINNTMEKYACFEKHIF